VTCVHCTQTSKARARRSVECRCNVLAPRGKGAGLWLAYWRAVGLTSLRPGCPAPLRSCLVQQRRHYIMALRRGAYQKRGANYTDAATLLR
jgi:hypothetical protein